MPIARSRFWPAVAVAAAVAALVVGVPMVTSGLPPTRGVLICVCGLTPVVIAAAMTIRAPVERTVLTVVLLVGGTVLAVAGVIVAARDDFLDLRLAMIDWRILVRATHAFAPVGWTLLGAAWVLAGVGLFRDRRRLVVIAGLAGSVVIGCAALSTAASGIYRIRQGLPRSVDGDAMVTAGILVAAALVTVVSALRMRGRLPMSDTSAGTPPSPAAPSRGGRRARTVAAVAVLAVTGGAIGAWAWQDRAPRLVVAEVFPDEALAGCVASTLGHGDVSAGISVHDLDEILSLSCRGDGHTGIADLTGLERLRKLASLELAQNQASDLTPLADLSKLGRLGLTHNEVTDLTPLANLPVLTDLGLSGNAISDVSPLAEVATLRHLGLADNQITDVTALGRATGVVELDLRDNAVRDIAALAGLSELRRLNLSGNQVTDPAPLGGLPWLRMLDASRNDIADATRFAGFPQLDELWLGENPLTDVSALADLPSLMGVDLVGLDSATPGIDLLRARGVFVGMT